MTRLMAAILLLAGSAIVAADEVVLKDGKVIQYRILKDTLDTVEVQTVDNKTVTIAKKDIKDIRLVVPQAPLTGASFTGDESVAADKPVNLLALIDPKKNAINGEWKFNAGALVGHDGLLEIPYIPAGGSYDLELVLERKEGDQEVNIGLIGGGKPFAFILDWGKGSANGLSVISGARVYENESKIAGKQLLQKKPRHIVCSVRPNMVVITMDGKEFLRWEGDVQKLSYVGRTKEQNLFLWFYQSTVAVQKLVLTPRK